jgi:hypothetical protein
VWRVTPGKSTSVWWLDTWCAELGLWDGRYLWNLWHDEHSLVGEICATFGHKFPWVCYVQHTLPCVFVMNDVQGIATHSYMHHPVNVKRSYLPKGSFERVICCLVLMLFMSVHLSGFSMVKPTIVVVLKLCFLHTICHTFNLFRYIFVIHMELLNISKAYTCINTQMAY